MKRGFVVSHPFRQKTRKGWGTEVFLHGSYSAPSKNRVRKPLCPILSASFGGKGGKPQIPFSFGLSNLPSGRWLIRRRHGGQELPRKRAAILVQQLLHPFRLAGPHNQSCVMVLLEANHDLRSEERRVGKEC